jgi:tetratricopeptide (TPR) repeat protein
MVTKKADYICRDNLKQLVLKTKLRIAIIAAGLVSGTCLAQSSSAAELQQRLENAATDTARVNASNRLAYYFRNSDADSTALYAAKAAALSQRIGYSLGLAEALINQGNAAIVKGNYAVALQLLQKSQTQYNRLLAKNDKDILALKGLARALATMGVVYTQQSNYFMALENYQKALKLYESAKDTQGIAKALNNIGIIYKSKGNYTKALDYLKQAYQLQSEIKEPNAAMTLTNIGVIYFESGKPEQAFPYYNQALKAFAQFPNPIGLALLHNYLGDYHRRTGNAAEAEMAYRKSLELYENMQNKFGASLALYNIGKLYASQQKYAEAMPFAQQSLAFATQIGVLDQTYHSEKLVSELYGSLNKTAESFRHYKNYIVARDSIINQENARKFAQAEMDFEYRKKEALLTEQSKRHQLLLVFTTVAALLLIILALVIYNRRQVKRRLTLQKEVAEYEQKALHLQMNPHFVFNCLGAISSFIVQNGTDSALKYLSKFSKLMRLTLEYSKGSLIPIDKEIESLQNYLELEQLRFNHKFEFKIESTEKVEFNMGLPPLLIQPFVENAILHGLVPKEGNGRIDVRFDVQQGQLLCTVTDNGIGLTESKLLKENSVTAHKSMALEITKKRLEMMESTTSKTAQIDIEELENRSGTRVTLKLPVQYIP